MSQFPRPINSIRNHFQYNLKFIHTVLPNDTHYKSYRKTKKFDFFFAPKKTMLDTSVVKVFMENIIANFF